MRHEQLLILSVCTAGLGFSGIAGGGEPVYQLFPRAEIVLATFVANPSDLLSPVLGDANGDGVPDLLRLRRDTSEGFVFLSTARGVWEERVLGDLGIPDETRVQGAAGADVDNDGDIDLVCWAADGTLGDRAIGTLLNDGSGNFAPVASDPFDAPGLERVALRGSVRPSATIAIGDVTGDGLVDAVVVSDGIAVFAGDGAGRFSLLFYSPASGSGFTSVEINDADGDGVNEIVTTSRGSISFRVWDSGELDFITARVFADELRDATSAVSVPRCDGESGATFVVVDGGSPSGIDHVQTFTVDGEFSVETGPVGALPSGATAVAAVDVIGGPGPDLVSPSSEAFADVDCTEFDTLDVRPASGTAFGVADLDLDGNGDLVSMGNRTYRAPRTVSSLGVRMIEGEGEGRGVAPPRVESLLVPNSESVFIPGVGVGDFDGDGRRDVFVSSSGSPTSRVFHQNADGSFTPLVLPLTAPASRVLVADVDGDGLDDVVLRTTGTRVQVNFSEPGRAFAPRVGYETGFPSGSVGLPAVGDVNSDGLADIVVDGTGGFSVLLQTAPRVFEIASSWSGDASGVGIDLGDIDGDGDSDLAVAAGPDFGVLLFESNGDGTFASPTEIGAGSFTRAQPLPELLEFADVDGDGDLDLLNFSEDENRVVISENDGNGLFLAEDVLAVVCDRSAEPRTLLSGGVADFNNDGFADIAIGCGDGEIAIYAGSGDAAFGWELYAIMNDFPDPISEISVDDINADGFPDLVVPFARGDSPFDPVFAGFQQLENLTKPQMRCLADFALPIGTLDLADISAFVTAFAGAGDPAEADVAAPFGLLDLADIAAFVTAFVNGCG